MTYSMTKSYLLGLYRTFAFSLDILTFSGFYSDPVSVPSVALSVAVSEASVASVCSDFASSFSALIAELDSWLSYSAASSSF